MCKNKTSSASVQAYIVGGCITEINLSEFLDYFDLSMKNRQKRSHCKHTDTTALILLTQACSSYI